MKLNREVVKGSLALLIGVNLFSAAGFLFQLSMARLLTLAQYGVLASLFAIVYLFGIFTELSQTLIARYSSKLTTDGQVKNLVKRATKKSLSLGVGVFFVFVLASWPISKLLNISFWLVAFTGLFAFTSFLLPVTRGVLQGKKRFFSLGANFAFEGIIKVGFGIFLVLYGLEVYGAVGGALFASLFAFALSFIPLKKVLASKESNTNLKEIYDQTPSTLVIILAIIAAYSLDVVVARAIFSPEVAGTYSIVSIIAKIIFLGTQPIGKALLPISSKNSNNEKEKKNEFVNAFLLLLLCAGLAVLLLYAFPNQIVSLFSGKDLISLDKALIRTAFATSILSIANLVLMYKLARGKTTGAIWLIPCVVAQIIILSRAKDIINFSEYLIISYLIILIVSVLFVGREKK